MYNNNHLHVHQERSKDLQRKAAQERLANEARRHNQRRANSRQQRSSLARVLNLFL